MGSFLKIIFMISDIISAVRWLKQQWINKKIKDLEKYAKRIKEKSDKIYKEIEIERTKDKVDDEKLKDLLRRLNDLNY